MITVVKNLYSMIEFVRLFKFPLLLLQLVSIIKSEKRKMQRSFFTPDDDTIVSIS